MEIINIKTENFLVALDREKFIEFFNGGVDAVFKAFEEMQAIIIMQAKQIDEIKLLKVRIKELEDQLAKDSHNSSKPPSSDGLKKKPCSLREPGNKKIGGQEGHKGHNLKMVEKPDYVIVHKVKNCKGCGCSLEKTEVKDHEKRQMFDIPPMKIETTEHRSEIKDCPRCGMENKADFPADVKQIVQYGFRIKALNTYLMKYQYLPYDRTREFFFDVFGHRISTGTLKNINERCHENLDVFEEQVKELLIQSPVVNFDETGISCTGKLHWLHSASTPQFTYYAIHPKRGIKGMEFAGILPTFKGIAVHDCWSPYFKYTCNHALCNSHNLRELIFVHEQENALWADDMIKCLLEIKTNVEEEKTKADCLDTETIKTFENKYNLILEEGLKSEALAMISNQSIPQAGKRGRKKQTKSKNLLDRLKNYSYQILAFMHDFRIPFDNNLAERDIRMTKLKQKISGTFRSQRGANFFCRIRSYISTVKKHELNILEALQMVFLGHAFIPT